jgi:peptidoglycan/LPS O-acetylase OafA/YrhL
MKTNTELRYVPGLDSLRGLACLSVTFFHSDLVTKSVYVPFWGGFLGVDLFFVLSGFLITTILVNQYERDSTIKFKNFYIKRILRLYPPILIAIIVFLVPLLFTDKAIALTNIISLMTYTGDCAMLVQHFTHLPYPLLSGHSWSLAIEEQFYLTFPFILLLILRFYTTKKKGNFISFFPVFLLLYCLVVIGSTILLGKWFYKFFFWRFFEIYMGSFVAIIYSEAYQRLTKETSFSSSIKNTVYKVFGNRIVLFLSILITILLLVYPSEVPFFNFMAKYNLHYVLFTLSSAVLIINLVYTNRPIYSRVLSNKVLVSLGKVSYGLYLYTPFISHKTAMMFFGGNPFQSRKTMLEHDLISIIAAIAFSYLSYYLIEKNILKLKSRFEPESTASSVVPAVSPIH